MFRGYDPAGLWGKVYLRLRLNGAYPDFQRFLGKWALLCLAVLGSCTNGPKKNRPDAPAPSQAALSYAKGYSIEKHPGHTILRTTSPWSGASKTLTYALTDKEGPEPPGFDPKAFDAVIRVPVERMVVTSTTHIAALEALEALESVVGFPETDLISSPKARSLVEMDKIKTLGNHETLNTELTLAMAPQLVVGFGIDGPNRAYDNLIRAGIPVVYNGDWLEETPLGKAEWIKFFALFLQKEILADSIFSNVENEYRRTAALAQESPSRPTVLVGGLFRDVWHVPGGKSWMAHFLADANSHYLWDDNNDIGGVAVSIETVLEKGKHADFWLNPSGITSYAELGSANPFYPRFDAYKNRLVYSNALAKGPTGGSVFFELAPQRPDLVLKDLIQIFHPGLLPDHDLLFFKHLP